ncbi:hypothetical protein H0H87_011567 [Tephrocybe sp. NHM501043]|nr:hypothetical protein H0H87_011567 [Tephrocybe sp. NHM501043]
MSAFGNFGANNAGGSGSTANTGGLFGAAKPATGGGLFGAPAMGTTPVATGGALGGTSGGSIFGNTANSTTSTSTPTASLFGGGSTSSSTAPAPTNIFGSKPAPASSATPAGTGVFGAAPTSLFGASSTSTPTSTTPAPTSTNPLFGGLNKPADANAPNASKPAGTGLFGTTPAPPAGGLFSQSAKPDATASASTGAAPNTSTPAPAAAPSNLFGGGGLFGAKPTATQPAAPTTTPSTSTPAPTANNFFAKPAEKDGAPAGKSYSWSTSTASATGGLFGAKPTDPKEATAAAPSFGGLFGKPAEKKDGSAPAAPAPSFGSTTPAAGKVLRQTLHCLLIQRHFLAFGTSAPSTGPGVSVAPPSTLKGKTIEEIVNKWSTDLETHVREFNKFAGEVAVWDRALIENSNTLSTLYGHVEAAERDQSEIDQSLDHIEQQQTELASTLVAYEKVAQEILGSQGGMRALDTGPADTERDKNYMLATDLHTHLDDLSGSLTQMIDSVNALSLPSIDSTPTEDPMAQIAQILSSHLESLQWIDGAVQDVEGKITEVEQRVKENGHNLPSSGQKGNRTFGPNR